MTKIKKMIIANQKKNENIVEYIIYMMQIQDIIRACNFDINIIEKTLIDKYMVPEKDKTKIKEWYSDLMISMNKENIKTFGNLGFLQNIMNELNDLHLKLINDKNEMQYNDTYNWAKKNIYEYKEKSKIKSDNEVEICINALYSLILLRLKKTEINIETRSAMQTFSNLMALLSAHYHNKI